MLIKTSSVSPELLLKKFNTNSKLLELTKYTKTDDCCIEAFGDFFPVIVKAKKKKTKFLIQFCKTKNQVYTYRVERVWSVSKAPGEMVVSWLSYSDSRRTLYKPVKLLLWMQLMRLFRSILKKIRGLIVVSIKTLIKSNTIIGNDWGTSVF